MSNRPVQSKITMAFAAFFLGTLGIHRWLMGYKNWWWMTLCLGGLGIWNIIDMIRILQGKMKMADQRDLL